MRDRGSSTILALTLVSVLILVAAGLAGVGRLLAAHVQATAAADAAALAAAPLTFLGGDPAAEAAAYAARNGARLIRCRCEVDPSFDKRVAAVEVIDQVRLPFWGDVTVRGRAAAEFDPLQLLGG